MSECNPRDLIEQAARDPSCDEMERFDGGGYTPSRHIQEWEARLSIAISLKRLADVAETTAIGLWNYDPTRDPFGNPKPHHPGSTIMTEEIK